MKKFMAIFVVLFSVANVFSQETGPTSILNFYDSSVIRCKPTFKSIELTTKYSKFEVPTRDILKIELGYHCEDKLYENIVRNIKNLAHADHKERVMADEFLRAHIEYSYFPLYHYKSPDREVSKRIQEILDGHSKNYNLATSDVDVVYLNDGSILKGKIKGGRYEFSTSTIDSFRVGLYNLKTITLQNNETRNYVLKGAVATEWVDSGIYVVGPFIISARGSINLAPESGPDYITSPKGLLNTYVFGYPTGSLLVKVNNNIYQVGNEYSGQSQQLQKLYFKVNTNFNDTPSGHFDIEIK